MSAAFRRPLRDYQSRRFLWICLVLAVWVGCAVLAGPIAGTAMFALAGVLLLVMRLTLGPLAESPLAPVLALARRRPWRTWDEVLDVLSSRLDVTFRTTLDGRLSAACLVEAVVDVVTLERISERITLATAEDELTSQYIGAIQTFGANLAFSTPPRVALRADANMPLGAVKLVPDFRPPSLWASPAAPTLDMRPGWARSAPVDAETIACSPVVTRPNAPDLEIVLPDARFRFEPRLGREITIGASAKCDVRLTEGAIEFASRIHAVISWNGSAWQLQDRSTNGTYVDGLAIEEVELTDNCAVTFGSRPDAPRCRARLRSDASSWPSRDGHTREAGA